MILIVDIIGGQLVQDTLTRQGCHQLVIKMLRRNKGPPIGPTGPHLEAAETHLA